MMLFSCKAGSRLNNQNTHKDTHNLLRLLKRHYMSVLSGLTGDKPRSYGFEYEFLPTRPLSIDDVAAVGGCLAKLGFASRKKDFIHPELGMCVSFEPGGQIEYCSPPLKSSDHHMFQNLLSLIQQTNAQIKSDLGIEYIGTDFLPGRESAPLCLTSERYRQLHARLSRVGSRGLEMMKGTASIHLHVVISNFANLLPLFNALCELSVDKDFRMSWHRRHIWDHTDATRCGRPPCCFANLQTVDQLIHRLIGFALRTEVLGEDVPFAKVGDQSYEAFLNHMTTVFTDVRFNLKGPTLELRTLDSMPVSRFKLKWRKFILTMESF